MQNMTNKLMSKHQPHTEPPPQKKKKKKKNRR